MKEIALLIPILVPLAGFALAFGIVYLNTKESLAMIDKGMNPKTKAPGGPQKFRYLKWGLMLVGAGLGLLTADILDTILNTRNSGNPPAAMYFSLVAIGAGAGLIISYKMEIKEQRQRPGNTNLPSGPSEP